jgi:hypothetical protein
LASTSLVTAVLEMEAAMLHGVTVIFPAHLVTMHVLVSG